MSKTLLITGASTGLGAETARQLADGNEIFIHYNASKESAEQVATDVEKRGGKAYLLQADLSKEAGCRNLVKGVYDQSTKLDVLVNNAGGLIRRNLVREYEWELIEKVFALNIFSAMMVTSLSVHLLEKGDDPRIINITSVAIRHGAPTATFYGAAKAALDSFTRGAAKELAPTIRVNSVAPGVILTPFHDKVSSPEQLEAWRENTPLKKHGDPIHIALTIKFIIVKTVLSTVRVLISTAAFLCGKRE